MIVLNKIVYLFFFISDKKVWCYYNFIDAASLRNKIFIFLVKVSRIFYMNILYVYSYVYVFVVIFCFNFLFVIIFWLFDIVLFYYYYVNIYIFFIVFLGVGIEIKIFYFCMWEKYNVFMFDFFYFKLLKVFFFCFMD